MEQTIDPGALKRLRQAGFRPAPTVTAPILELGASAIPELSDLARDMTILGAEAPKSYGALHALRLLRYLPAGAEAEALLRTPLPSVPLSDAILFWEEEITITVGAWGAGAMPGIEAVLADSTADEGVQARAALALAFVAEAEPTLRETVIARLLELLSEHRTPIFNAHVVEGLAELHAAETYGQVMSAYRQGLLDKTIYSAAEARQKLLTSSKGGRLLCVHHTLEEQYDTHGPFTEEQRKQMKEHA
ncbi:MAG: hypothetical protein NVS4B8_16240 [Herpetosiphon sp.]